MARARTTPPTRSRTSRSRSACRPNPPRTRPRACDGSTTPTPPTTPPVPAGTPSSRATGSSSPSATPCSMAAALARQPDRGAPHDRRPRVRRRPRARLGRRGRGAGVGGRRHRPARRSAAGRPHPPPGPGADRGERHRPATADRRRRPHGRVHRLQLDPRPRGGRRGRRARSAGWCDPDGRVVWYDLRRDNPRNREVRGVPEPVIGRLFPGWSRSLRTCTVLPPLARRAARVSPRSYDLLGRVPALRTHHFGVLSAPDPGRQGR